MRAVVVSALLAACASTPVVPHDPPFAEAVARPPDAERFYTIWLGGARVGTAVERETWSVRGVTLVREETMRFARGDAPVELVTTIAVEADAALVPSRVTWTEQSTATRSTAAYRADDGWHVDPAARAARIALAPDAVPAELVPLIVARDGRFDAPVFLPARGFLGGRGHIEPVAPARLVARLALAGGMHAEATIDTQADGTYARVVDGEGVIAMRATPAEASAPFPLVDLIAATAIPITGGRTGPITLLGDLALPAVPGQAAHAGTTTPAGVDGIELELSPQLPGNLPDDVITSDRTTEIALLVSLVREQITPDLGAGPASTTDAIAATAGDCTTFALAYAAHARERAIPTRIVTGLRIDGDHLLRHRWAVSWTGTAWIAVDAAFGAAPAGGDLIGLAVHDADDAGLIAGEAALMQVRGALRGRASGPGRAARP